MPIARVRTATAVNPGCLRRLRSAKRRSSMGVPRRRLRSRRRSVPEIAQYRIPGTAQRVYCANVFFFPVAFIPAVGAASRGFGALSVTLYFVNDVLTAAAFAKRAFASASVFGASALASL